MNFYVNVGYLKDCIVLSLALASGMSKRDASKRKEQ